jgi:anthranilate phosphoribosyltransferase
VQEVPGTHEVVGTLITGDRPVDVAMWHSFWDDLGEGTGHERCERAVALLASLLTQVPDERSVGALVDSLHERHATEEPPLEDAVNIVGTGGGPSTFNMSTATAFVAAALGVRIVKSGSRAYTSRYGSIDVLELLGVPLTRSHEATHESLEDFGIAFAGPHVYPRELTLLAKNIMPVEMRRLGRFFNTIGPFLAAVPAQCQVTGVSDRSRLPLLGHLATHHCERAVWLCSNDVGVDELVSFADNVIRHDDGTEVRITPDALGLTPGTIEELRPALDPDSVARQFRALLEGDAEPAAIESIALNAASLVVASGLDDDWVTAFEAAMEAIEEGVALELLERLRDQGPGEVPVHLHARKRSATLTPNA